MCRPGCVALYVAQVAQVAHGVSRTTVRLGVRVEVGARGRAPAAEVAKFAGTRAGSGPCHAGDGWLSLLDMHALLGVGREAFQRPGHRDRAVPGGLLEREDASY